ncbi:MAG TPA: DUF1570 domain-containing protein [Lacunisphaera sp.]|jgi:hypothetical protein
MTLSRGRISSEISRCLFLGAWGLAFILPANGREKWQKIVAPQFTLYSPGRSADVLRVATEFQQFIGSLGDVIQVDPRTLPPLTIVIFDRDKDFRPFRPLKPNGKPWDVAGFFSRQEGWSVFGLAGTDMDEDLRRTVFHEGVHWYLSGSDLPNPVWMEEGLAEVFSTFAVKKGRREWGQPIDNHVITLRSSSPLPLEKLLSVSRSSPLFNETQRTGLFYAESWAFVHYLLFGEHNQDRTLFNDYSKAFRSNALPEDTFKSVFKKDYAGMDRELYAYLNSGKYFVGSRPISTDAAALVIEPATDLERELALARLALGSGRPEVVQEHIAAAQALDKDSLATNEVAGYAAGARGDTAAMIDYFTVAAKNGSKDYRVYFELAQRSHQSASDIGGMVGLSGEDARLIASNYEKTINLRPWFLPAYQGLGGVVELLGSKNEEDQKFLTQGHQLFPSDGMITIGLAAAAHNAGASSEARSLLAAVISTADKQTPAVVTYAQRLDDAWNFNEANEKISALVEARHFAEALSELDALLAKGVPASARPTLGINRANLQGRILLEQAHTAWDERRWTDVRKFLGEIINSPFPTGAKYEARRKLAELDRRNPGREPGAGN